MLYDADRIQEAASVPAEKDLYQAHLDIFLDPFDPEVIAAARREGIPDSWLEGAKASPVYKLAIDWKLALPLHPEYRTLRSEEHTSELQSLMRISYAVFCLKKKKK